MSDLNWEEFRTVMEDIDTSSIGIESLTMGREEKEEQIPSYFKPVVLTNKNGIYRLSIYANFTADGTKLSEQLLLFFKKLKETDEVKLTITSMTTNVPVFKYSNLISAIARCAASVEIQLDTMVDDELAYFYLAADKIKVGSMGDILIPAYCDQVPDDKSSQWKALHDFFAWIVDLAVERGILNGDEASELHQGGDIVIDRHHLISLSV